MSLKRPQVGSLTLILGTSLFLLVALNGAYVSRLLAATPGEGIGALDATMIGLVLAINVMLLSLLALPKVAKPALVTVILVAAVSGYFMQVLGAVVDRHAIASVFESDAREAAEWLSPGLVAWIALLGVLPALLIAFVRIEFQPAGREIRNRLLANGLLFGVVLLSAWPQTQALSSLLRNHGELRHYANPFAALHAVRGYVKHEWAVPSGPPLPVGTDARVAAVEVAGSTGRKPRLLMLVVGESARAASFQLAGYPRPTNPRLSRYPLVSSFDVHSCGTNTATSLPCMFSNLGEARFDVAEARGRENLLDVLRHAGMHVVWRDNNTGSKHIADRVVEEDFAHRDDRRWCQSGSCRDEILLEGLDAELHADARDTAIVLHLLGSHGPAYFERYPPEFAVFQPECRSAELATCTPEEIRNSYDNTIRYTDHVLARAIDWLDTRDDYDTALLFASDHGESTGESGFFLHGAPKVIAPDEQTHVPMLAWLSPGFTASQGLDMACARQAAKRELDHDYWFHTVLGLGDVKTSAYRSERDLFQPCRETRTAGERAEGSRTVAPG